MYELFLMFLLGYSLVEYPRQLWQAGDVRGYLVKTQMKAASEFKAISEHQLSVSLVCADVLKTKAALANYADPRLMEAMEILLSGKVHAAKWFHLCLLGDLRCYVPSVPVFFFVSLT